SQLTSLPGLSQFSDWSPDGSTIAFESDASGSPQIYTISSDGEDLKQLTTEGGYHPSWSPDGQQISFSRIHGEAEDLDIFVMNKDGTNVTQITNNDLYDHHSSWQSIANLPPSAQPDSLTTVSSETGSINVLTNDSDEEPL